VVLANAHTSEWILRLSRREPLFHAKDVGALVLLAGSVGWGWCDARLLEPTGTPSGVAIVQASIPQDQKWSAQAADGILEKHVRLTEEAAKPGVSLVLWPESSSPFPLARPSSASPGGIRPNLDYRERLEALTGHLGISLLFGTVDYRKVKGEVKPVNAAALVRADGTWGDVYAKMHLVPFGEYVPMRAILTFVNRLAEGSIGDFAPGDKPVVVSIDLLRVGTAICYEIIFPELVRSFSVSGATVLANLTNDAWFGTSAGPLQHFQMARLRAVENRLYVVRAANTGISAVVDPWGRVVVSTRLMEERVLWSRIFPRRTRSFYARHGDSFVILCAILAAAALAAGIARRAGREGPWLDE